MEQIDYVTILFSRNLKEKSEVLLNRFRSRILALARKVVGGGVLLIYMCAIDSMHEIQLCLAVEWPRRLCVAMARCFKKTYWAPTVGDMRLYMDENT